MFGKLTKIMPVIHQVVDVIDAIVDCADEGNITPEESARLVKALDALASSIRIKGKPIQIPGLGGGAA